MFELRFTVNEGRYKKGLDEMTDSELSRMLIAIGEVVKKGNKDGLVTDMEGNIIGTWKLTKVKP